MRVRELKRTLNDGRQCEWSAHGLTLKWTPPEWGGVDDSKSLGHHLLHFKSGLATCIVTPMNWEDPC
jgi:hypothetical protein